RDLLPIELGPHLVGPVDPVVGLPDPADLALQPLVAPRAGRGRPRAGGGVGGGGDLERAADRLDPEALPVGVDVGAHRLGRQSSSPAKKTEAVVRISLARRSSRFSRSSSRMRSASELVVPARSPRSISAW